MGEAGSKFSQLHGVESTVIGYKVGRAYKPTWQSVTSSCGGSVTIRVTYDPTQITYATLLDVSAAAPVLHLALLCHASDAGASI